MPNKKTKQQMKVAKRNRAIAEAAKAREAADKFDDDRLLKMAEEYDARGEPLNLPKLSVKNQKLFKIKKAPKSPTQG